MLAHYHSQVWNAAQLSRAMGVGESTSRRYLDLLTDAFVVRQLQPWHANLKKRQVKSPKVTVRDSGLLHQLLGIDTERTLELHPKVGASWEGYVVEQVLEKVRPEGAWFWATYQGAEMDLVLQKDGRMFGVECKRMDAPRMTSSIRIALEDLDLESVSVVYPGSKRYPIAEKVEAVPLGDLAEDDLLPVD